MTNAQGFFALTFCYEKELSKSKHYVTLWPDLNVSTGEDRRLLSRLNRLLFAEESDYISNAGQS